MDLRAQYERESSHATRGRPCLTVFYSSPDSLGSTRVNPYPLPSVQSPQSQLYASHPRITLETPTKDLIAYLFSPPDPRFVHRHGPTYGLAKRTLFAAKDRRIPDSCILEHHVQAQKRMQNGVNSLINCSSNRSEQSMCFYSIRARCRARAASRPLDSALMSKGVYHGFLRFPQFCF